MKIRLGIRSAAFAIALGAAVAASALAPLRSAAGEPHRYRSEIARFDVEFPEDTPVIRELTGSKFSTTDNDLNYAVVSDGVEFSVEIHDVPRFARLMLTSHYILDHSVSGKLEDIDAHEIDVTETSFQGEPAREVVFEALDRTFTGRMLLVLADRRIYLVSVQHPPSLDPRDASARFFASFSFWPE